MLHTYVSERINGCIFERPIMVGRIKMINPVHWNVWKDFPSFFRFSEERDLWKSPIVVPNSLTWQLIPVLEINQEHII